MEKKSEPYRGPERRTMARESQETYFRALQREQKERKEVKK